MIGESPLTWILQKRVKPGEEQLLAVRVTHPGGNFHWQDFTEMNWGSYQIPPGRSFGGIIGRVRLDAVSPLFISDIYMQNQPEYTKVKAILTVNNTLMNTEKATHVHSCRKRKTHREYSSQGFEERYLAKGRKYDNHGPELPECETLEPGFPASVRLPGRTQIG